MMLLPFSVIALVGALCWAVLGEDILSSVFIAAACLNEALAAWARRPADPEVR